VITLYTIGFTKKSAEHFFSLIREVGVKCLLDVRLSNSSQLAGFAKKDDLAFFMREICHANYVHLPQFAPTQDILDAFKKEKGDWETYEMAFNKLLVSRRVEETVNKELLDGGCLLCSEDRPEKCHRRLTAEYLQKYFPDMRIVHLLQKNHIRNIPQSTP
jgi:uncharacterized protein (DUF488 family)